MSVTDIQARVKILLMKMCNKKGAVESVSESSLVPRSVPGTQKVLNNALLNKCMIDVRLRFMFCAVQSLCVEIKRDKRFCSGRRENRSR